MQRRPQAGFGDSCVKLAIIVGDGHPRLNDVTMSFPVAADRYLGDASVTRRLL